MNPESRDLLRVCARSAQQSAGVIGGLLPSVEDRGLRETLERGRKTCAALSLESRQLLERGGQEPERTGGAARLKSAFFMTPWPSDCRAAAHLSACCGGEARTLVRAMNRKRCAEAEARALAERLLGFEDGLAGSLRPYL